jgi:hypothetical protein
LKPIYAICRADMDSIRKVVLVLLATLTTDEIDVAHLFGETCMLNKAVTLT